MYEDNLVIVFGKEDGVINPGEVIAGAEGEVIAGAEGEVIAGV